MNKTLFKFILTLGVMTSLKADCTVDLAFSDQHRTNIVNIANGSMMVSPHSDLIGLYCEGDVVAVWRIPTPISSIEKELGKYWPGDTFRINMGSAGSYKNISSNQGSGNSGTGGAVGISAEQTAINQLLLSRIAELENRVFSCTQ